MTTLLPYVLIGVGGCFGALARFVVSHATSVLLDSRFPFGTLIVNVSGSFLLGLLYALVVTRLGAAEHSEAARLAFGVGFLGSFTTFSTFALDTHVLLTDGWPGLATANVLVSAVAGLLAVRAGLIVGNTCL